MARVIFSGVEPRVAGQLAEQIAADGHEVEWEKKNPPIERILDADVVFASGEPGHYLSVLRRVRALKPTLCFVVVAPFPGVAEWLDAIEASATDYWPTPLHSRQVRSLIASITSRRITATAAEAGSRR